MMEEYIYYNDLYDCYYKLLTDKQRSYFEEYYFHNLSFSEISENYKVSRNAIFKQIQITIKKLVEYEEKLKLLERKKQLQKVIVEIQDQEIKEKIKLILD